MFGIQAYVVSKCIYQMVLAQVANCIVSLLAPNISQLRFLLSTGTSTHMQEVCVIDAIFFFFVVSDVRLSSSVIVMHCHHRLCGALESR